MKLSTLAILGILLVVAGCTPASGNEKIFRSEEHGFEFRYPKKLALEETGNEVILHHSIPYENTGDCDMVGETTVYSTLEDFRISIQLIEERMEPEYSDGEYQAGSLQGTWVYQGAEGCGHFLYYFPIKDHHTLLIKRASIQALSGISTHWNREEILRVPGVISPEESENIFRYILSSIRLI